MGADTMTHSWTLGGQPDCTDTEEVMMDTPDCLAVVVPASGVAYIRRANAGNIAVILMPTDLIDFRTDIDDHYNELKLDNLQGSAVHCRDIGPSKSREQSVCGKLPTRTIER